MKALFETAAELEAFLKIRNWRYSFIGGIALQRWGEPRLTNDIDITIFTGFSSEDRFIAELLSAYQPRIDEAAAFAIQNRVLLLITKERIPIDVAFGGIPFEERLIERSSRFEFLPGLSLLTCSAEDLIVLKAFADRPRDWADIETVLIRQAGRIDGVYVRESLSPLCELKESPHILERLNEMLSRM